GKDPHLLALPALLSVHMKRLADNNLMHFILLDKLPESTDILLKVFALDCRPSLRGQKKGIAHGHSDGLVTHVECHNPHILMIQPHVHRAIIKRRFKPVTYLDVWRSPNFEFEE